MKNVIVLNNRDSFVFNLVQILTEIESVNPIVIDESDALNDISKFENAKYILLSLSLIHI